MSSIYYGWWVLAACCFLAVFAGSIFSYGFTVFFLPIQHDLVLSSAATSLVFALARGEAGIGGPLIGWLVDRFDSRPIVLIGGLMAGVGLIVLSGIHNYWLFLLVYVGIISVGNNSSFGQTFLAVMNRWFVRHKAIAMTLVITCYTIGGAVMVPLLSRGVLHLGWRLVALYTGIFVALAVIPGSMLIRRSPESMGIRLEAVGEAAPTLARPGRAPRATGRDFTVKEALRTATYWFLLWASTFRIAVTSGILVHGIPIMVWKGTSEQGGADLLALMFFLSIPLRLLFGISGVRVPGQVLLSVGMAAGAVAILALNFLSGAWVLYFFVIGLAVLEGATTVNWVVVGSFFGRRNFATLTGIISVAYSAGMLASPLYLGWMFDKTQSYTVALTTFAAMYGASAILFAICRAPRPREG